jgi:hypothetical protein
LSGKPALAAADFGGLSDLSTPGATFTGFSALASSAAFKTIGWSLGNKKSLMGKAFDWRMSRKVVDMVLSQSAAMAGDVLLRSMATK